MSFEAPTVEEIAEVTEQSFEQVARDFRAVVEATEPVNEPADESSDDH